MKIFQKGFNYSQDGQGNRLVYHLQGCNMHCPWCANPEGMFPENPLFTKQKLLPFYTTEDIVKEVLSSKIMFFDGGGVTFTGGEPTLQFKTLLETLKALKECEINTAVESNATHPQLSELFPFVDQFIMDFKHWNSETHRAVTGLGNETIKNNIAAAFTRHDNVLIRTILIRGFNDTETDAEKFSEFYRQFDTSHARFEFLPYHEYGKTKWQQCGRSYTMKDAFVTKDVVEMYKNIYQKNHLTVIQT